MRREGAAGLLTDLFFSIKALLGFGEIRLNIPQEQPGILKILFHGGIFTHGLKDDEKSFPPVTF